MPLQCEMLGSVIPAKAGIHNLPKYHWIPAYAGMTFLAGIVKSSLGHYTSYLGLTTAPLIDWYERRTYRSIFGTYEGCIKYIELRDNFLPDSESDYLYHESQHGVNTPLRGAQVVVIELVFAIDSPTFFYMIEIGRGTTGQDGCFNITWNSPGLLSVIKDRPDKYVWAFSPRYIGAYVEMTQSEDRFSVRIPPPTGKERDANSAVYAIASSTFFKRPKDFGMRLGGLNYTLGEESGDYHAAMEIFATANETWDRLAKNSDILRARLTNVQFRYPAQNSQLLSTSPPPFLIDISSWKSGISVPHEYGHAMHLAAWNGVSPPVPQNGHDIWKDLGYSSDAFTEGWPAFIQAAHYWERSALNATAFKDTDSPLTRCLPITVEECKPDDVFWQGPWTGTNSNRGQLRGGARNEYANARILWNLYDNGEANETCGENRDVYSIDFDTIIQALDAFPDKGKHGKSDEDPDCTYPGEYIYEQHPNITDFVFNLNNILLERGQARIDAHPIMRMSCADNACDHDTGNVCYVPNIDRIRAPNECCDQYTAEYGPLCCRDDNWKVPIPWGGIDEAPTASTGTTKPSWCGM